MSARLQADDLFAGAGGWDVACDWLDLHARGVENMDAARQTRDAAGLTTAHDDVWTFKPRYTATHSGMALQSDGLIASPPCQTFSQAGKGSGRKALNDVLELLPQVKGMTLAELRKAGEVFGDDRTALVLTPLWFALHHPYRWLAWEQVPTVLPVWQACAEVLEAEGFSVWTGNLNAEQYGVPQTRKRAFLIASRDHAVTPPTPTHSRYYSRTPGKLDPGVRKWVSMAEALGWGLRRRPSYTVVGGGGGTGSTTNGSEWGGAGVRATLAEARHSGDAETWTPRPDCAGTGTSEPWHAPEEPCDCPVTFTATNPRPNAAHRTPCQPAPTLAFGHEVPRWNPRETTPDGLPRFAQQSDNVPDYDWPDNRPATVVAGRDLIQAPGATANRFNNSTKSRNDGVRVSVAEAGVLQSFPYDFPWQGTKSKQFLQAGNAVPPLLAMAALSSALGEPYLPPAPIETPESVQPALATL